MQFEKPDFVELLPILAHQFKAKVTNRHFEINSQQGNGYAWAEKIPSGITVLVSDTCLKDSLTVERLECDDHYFTLQFNEETVDEAIAPVKGRRETVEYESFVKLSHTSIPETFLFPASKRQRSVKFFFTPKHLINLVGKSVFDEVITNYFPVAMQTENLDPIATEYRIMLDELWNSKINQPLRLNYIQNRVLLLLEKYIVKLFEKRDLNRKKIRLNDEDILRLMKVEALLVKNFKSEAPSIDELSRISMMSPTKLKNNFKALYGCPIYQYFQKNRMRKAKNLLVKGETTIKQVGQDVGYRNLSHFAAAFEKEFGYLPSEIAAKDGVLIYS